MGRTPWHPHRGFETVTSLLDGIFRHQDSNGGGGLITDGDTQWRPRDIRGRAVTLLSSPHGGALLRLIAGEVAGHQGPGSTYTPITLLHATLAPGAQLRLPWRPDFTVSNLSAHQPRTATRSTG